MTFPTSISPPDTADPAGSADPTRFAVAGPPTSRVRTAARWLLGATLIFAGTSHLTFARGPFAAQVPPWAVQGSPFSADDIVLMSGVAEIALGSGLVLFAKDQRRMGAVAAAFFTAIFPGNFSQYIHHRDAFGLDTDTKRAVRLLGQPVLVAWAWWSTRQNPAR
ncbi:DoxX family protein [Kineococcus sp. NBC_00420]|uniref:DoxX family protein n=1 Tax=Kineococcus sp. NBC_00420 TaxID=2903564 RepID=UPI003FA60171